MVSCCVKDCIPQQGDTVFFQFPTSPSLRRKWLDVLNIGSKVPVDTVICSRHFRRREYQVVRGKMRLKSKVVPSRMLKNKSPSPPRTEDTCQARKENSVLPPEIIVDSNPSPPNPTTGTVCDENTPIGRIGRGSRSESKEKNGESADICKVVNKIAVSSRNRVERDLIEPDFEEMITNYQIKNNKPNSLLPQEIEIEVPPASESDTIVVNDKGDTPAVFIEIPVGKGNNTTNASTEDCLMVLESVQVDIDPGSLMLPERDFEEQPAREEQNVKPPDKKEDPISLLTSSDEDDVIIQEPHIDTIEVSDETDEDDMPLVKLLKKKSSKKKAEKKKQPEASSQEFKSLTWNGAYDFYCMQCHFIATDSIEFNEHLREHQTVLQICSVCGYTTASKIQYTRHLRKHKEEKTYQCHLCEYRSRHNMSLIYHIQSHGLDKDLVKHIEDGFKCAKCGFCSSEQSVVLRHIRGCGANVKLHFCDWCDHATKRKSDLKQHCNRKHRDKIVELNTLEIEIAP